MTQLNERGQLDSIAALQSAILEWQQRNFPTATEVELALGVCEEAGELAACVLKQHRHIRAEEYDDARLRDAIGDLLVYTIGICGSKNWALEDVLRETASRVLKRDWTTPASREQERH